MNESDFNQLAEDTMTAIEEAIDDCGVDIDYDSAGGILGPFFKHFPGNGSIGLDIVAHEFGVPFYIFLLRQFFMTIPRDLEDAARMDGANTLQLLVHVLLPVVRPAIAHLVG